MAIHTQFSFGHNCWWSTVLRAGNLCWRFRRLRSLQHQGSAIIGGYGQATSKLSADARRSTFRLWRGGLQLPTLKLPRGLAEQSKGHPMIPCCEYFWASDWFLIICIDSSFTFTPGGIAFSTPQGRNRPAEVYMRRNTKYVKYVDQVCVCTKCKICQYMLY